MTYFKNVFRVGFPLGVLDIIFGITNVYEENILSVLNFCILYGKNFIKKQKLNDKNISIELFLPILANRLEAELCIAMENDNYEQFTKVFDPLYSKCLEDVFI